MARQVTGTTNQHLYVDTGVALNYPITISCRLKPIASSTGIALAYGDAMGGFVDANMLQLEGLAAVSARTLRSNDDFSATYTATLVAGGWYLLVGVFNGSGISETSRQIYLDTGAQVATAAVPSNPAVKNRTLTVGGVSVDIGSAVLGFDGAIADVAMWNTALTSADVDALAAGRPGDVKAANLQAWFPLGANGDLTSSVGTFGPMIEVGSCPVVADPPYLLPIPKLLSIASASYRDYLPGASINASLRDDPLFRDLRGWLPLSERGTRSINDPLNRGLPSSQHAMPVDVGYIPSAGTGAHTWDYDGGWLCNGQAIAELCADWNRSYWYTPFPPVTISCWVRNYYTGGTVWQLGVYTQAQGIWLKLLDYGSSRVQASRYASVNTLTSNIISTTLTQGFDGWMHCVVSLAKDGTFKLYCDGKLEGSHQDPTPQGSMDRLAPGSDSSGNGFFFGWLRDFRLWPRALHAREVAELYARGYAKNFRPVAPDRQFPAIWINPIQRIDIPRLAGAAALRPITVKGTKAHVQLGRLIGYAGIRPAMVKPEQLVRLFRLAGSAGLRTVQVKAHPKVTFSRLQGIAYLRALRVRSSPLFTLPRMVGYADLRALEFHTFRGLWHEELAQLYANQIERERRVLLGQDSMLEMFTQRGQSTELRKTLNKDFSAYHVSSLAGPEEWFLDIIETGNAWELMRELTDVCVKTHGQCLNFKILALERPVEKGHCYRMRLQAINDPRI